MRFNRNTVIFLTVIVVIGVGLLLFAGGGDNSGDETTSQGESDTQNTVLYEDVAADDIIAMEITTPQTGDGADADTADDDAATIIARYTRDAADSDWSLDDAVSTVTAERPLNQMPLTSAAGTLAGLVAVDQFEADDLAQYGLDAPSATLTFETADMTYRVSIGGTTPQGNRTYALVDDSETTVSILRGASDLNAVIDLATPPLQPIPTPTPEPQLTIPGQIFAALQASTITELSLMLPDNDEALVYTREDSDADWTLAGDEEARPLDPTPMSLAASEFASLRATSGTDTDDLAALGLDAPTVITATTADGTTYRLQVGDQDPSESLYYTLVNDFEQVALVPSDTLDSVIRILSTPTYPPEATAEATPDATAEATDDAGD